MEVIPIKPTMKMSFVDLQKSVGNLATKYPGFDFNIRLYDDSHNDHGFDESPLDYNGKEIVDVTFTEKSEGGSIMVNSSAFGNLDDTGKEKELAEIKTKAANLGIEHYDQIGMECGPYVWFTILFTTEVKDVVSDFPLDRLDEFVGIVKSVIDS